MSKKGRGGFLFLIVFVFLLVYFSSHATPQETPSPAPTDAVEGRVEVERPRFFGSRVKPEENVVVYLENAAIKPSPLPNPMQMIQRGKSFDPHMLIVTPGSAIDFPNRDPIFHNVFSPYYGQAFDLGLYKPGDSKRVQFEVPGVSWIFCDIHQEMSAIVLTLPTQYFAVTNRQGAFRILGVPDGTYRLNIWYEEVTPVELTRASRIVEITPVTRQLPVIQLSERGFVRIPHKNKFGKDYPLPSEDPRYRNLQNLQ